MSDFSKELLPRNERISGLEGVKFEGTIGRAFSEVDIVYPDAEASIRGLFERDEVKRIIGETKHFKQEYPQTFNGLLLGNPTIYFDGGKIIIEAEQLHYQVYFGAHEYRQNHKEIGENYAALSVCGVIYDTANECFYLSVRPDDSQEDPSKVDAPGGVLNPDYLDADPFDTARDRISKKLGITEVDVKSIGIEKIFDEKYSLYNIAMFGQVNDVVPTVEEEYFGTIKLRDVLNCLQSDELTTPAKATLLLALAQPQFEGLGWGKERVEKLLAASVSKV